MKNYERILLPLDGSKLSEAALPDAVCMAKLTGAEITLLRAVPPAEISISPAGVPFFIDELYDILRSACMDYLREISQREEFRDIKLRLSVMLGFPADVILDACQKEKIDLIVMATHGRSGVGRWVLGSVAEKVLRASSCPVLLVRSSAEGSSSSDKQEVKNV